MNDNTTDNDKPVLLLVDDDELYCSVLGNALEKRGYSVYTAHDLETAMHQASAHEPEYAVVDLRIGTESGLELVKQLAVLDENTRIVMLTGYASVATAVEAIKLGAVHYLAKPANADDVVAALQRTEGDTTVTPASTEDSSEAITGPVGTPIERVKHAKAVTTTGTSFIVTPGSKHIFLTLPSPPDSKRCWYRSRLPCRREWKSSGIPP